MNRPPRYWIWLLADMSLDRAERPLSTLGFPTGAHQALQRSMADAESLLRPGSPDLATGSKRLQAGLRGQLGLLYPAVEAWLRTFPFTDELGHPALHYWDSRLFDLLQLDPEPELEGMNDDAWSDLLAAFRGHPPKGLGPWAGAFKDAAAGRRRLSNVLEAIGAAREQPLSDHDLPVYLRMGWNDHGNNPGLGSLEIGARLAATRDFWRSVRPHVPQASLVRLAERRDRQGWEAASDPRQFAADAARLGCSPQVLAAEALPPPQPTPVLDAVLQDPA